MSTNSEPDYRALYIEAAARLVMIEWATGDFGGPFHPHQIDDVVHAIEWSQSLCTDPPDWNQDNDPLSATPDDVAEEIGVLARVRIERLKRETIAYHERTPWRPWWRTIPRQNALIPDERTE